MSAAKPEPAESVQPLDPAVLARGVIAGSKRHVAGSMGLAITLATVTMLLGASRVYLGIFAGAAVCMVLYNIVRIRAATRALDTPERGPAFVHAQQRSHQVRGTIYLVTSPVLVAATAIGLVSESPPPPPAAWMVFAGMALFIGYGWYWWLRALRRVRRWRAL